MRLPVFLGAVALALAVTGSALFLVGRTEPEEINALDESYAAAGAVGTIDELGTSPPREPEFAQPADSLIPQESGGLVAAHEPLPPEVEKRIAELEDLGTMDDPASLKAILAELGNSNAEIRKAALEAAVQFSSRDAIPGLAEAAARTTDPEEKKAIVEAIEFLKLPSLTEYLQQQQHRNGVQPTIRVESVRPAFKPTGTVPSQ